MAYRETAAVAARKSAQRQGILDAALALIRDGGFAAATVSAVALRAGVATGTLYRYFPNHADLLAETFRLHTEHEVEHLAAAAAEGRDCRARLDNAVRRFVRRALRAPRLAYAMIAEPVAPAVEVERLRYRQAYADIFRKLIEDGMARGEFAAQDARVSSAALVGALAEALLGPLNPGASSTRVAGELVVFCMRAVGAREPE